MKKKRKVLIPLLVLGVLIVAFFIYTGIFFHADAAAEAALSSDETVSVSQTDYGWLFDGPSESDALIFYPGAKVEETAYAPLLRRIAENGMDVCLVKMPFRLAFFAEKKADGVIAEYDYARWYVGGHSLGGAVAANYAAERGDRLTGVILLAAYPTKALDGELSMISIYGSEDGVLNRAKLAEGAGYAPDNSAEFVIEGGNHAQFGNYGVQNGDGEASLPAEEQQSLTAEMIAAFLPQTP